MTGQQLTLDDALAARDAGIRAVEEASDTVARNAIDQAIAHFAGLGVPFSANDTRPLLPDVRPGLVGARFMAAAKRGEIRKVGWVTSTDKGTHAKAVARWEGVG